MLRLLFPVVPDFDDEYWLLKSVSVDHVTIQNGVRVNEDLLHRVRRARLVAEMGAVVVSAFTERAR